MTGEPLPPVTPVVTPAEIVHAREVTRGIYVDEKIQEYVLDLVFATREPRAYGLDIGPLLAYGASPRATLALVRLARARALLSGRPFVIPEDVKAVGPAVLRCENLEFRHGLADHGPAVAIADKAVADFLAERVARDAMAERLGLELARYEAGEETSELSVITSGLHHLRQVFDLMPTEGTDAMANIAARLDNYPQALDQVRVTLLDAARAGHVAPRAQMLRVADQCDVWTDPEADDFFHALVGRLSAPATLTADLRRAASAATAATIAFGRFLRTELAPLGRDTEAAGRDPRGGPRRARSPARTRRRRRICCDRRDAVSSTCGNS